MGNRKPLIEFSGVITYQIISGILGDLKNKAELINTPVGVYKRLLAITDESLCNISMYAQKMNGQNFSFLNYLPFFYIENTEDTYYITVKSAIKENDKKVLTEQIDKLNGFNKQQLKELYKKIISNGTFTKEGGAGLGLIIISRSSENKIKYSSEKINEQWDYISLSIEISK